MHPDIDMKKIKRNTYHTYHQDGLWDVLVGLGFLGYGICVAIGFTSIAIIIPAIFAALFPNILLLKKKFTQPRLGYVVPRPEWKNKEARNLRLLIIAGVFSLIAGVINFLAFSGNSVWMNWIRNLELIPFGMVLSLIVFCVGIIYLIKRFMIYSAIILITFVLGHLIRISFPVHFIFLGIIFLITGLYYLINFVKKYPLVSSEDLNNA